MNSIIKCKSRKRFFTLTELLVAILGLSAALAVIAMIVAIGWCAFHFIGKYW